MYDIYASFDFGYDPDTVEEGPIARLTPPATLPKQATVNPAWLPPVGHQHTPSCFVWASVYGLATYNAAKAGNYSPRTAAQQASPYYAYVKVLEGQNVSSDICQGGKMVWCFSLLNQEDGTPSMQQAPEPVVAAGSNACLAVWSDYGSAE
ncbi:MAG TPA: hypothetical protein VMA86_03235, partial [Acetobacteraceae bacterium]|nr:hypothetical protein [Acetobacteraceae bacterium]